MELIILSQLNPLQKNEIHELWNREYPKKICHNELSDFENYLAGKEDPCHMLLLNDKGKIIAWYFDFIRRDEKWFVLILDSAYHGKGIGTQMLDQAKEKEIELNGWVIDRDPGKKLNGEDYRFPLGFYLKNGFEILSDVRLELEKISAVKIKWKKSIDN